jgi:autotransporter-associated beta strand protein
MGAAVGSDLFAVSGASLTFAPGSSDTITLTGTIADDSPASISSTSTWNPGTGSGAALTMQGPGKLVLNGVNTYAGLTTVSGGTLFINGQILGGISVSSGATLSGTGTIYGGGTINGTLSPGSSSSVITFETSAGNLTLGGSSVTNIEIASMNRSHIEITGSGSAALGGTVHVTQNAGSYGSSGEYQILNGSYTGEFNPTVTGGLPGYEFSLSYMAPYIYLLYECPGCSFSIPTTGLSGNALTIANYLNNYASSSTLSLLNTLSGDELQSALNSVSPSRNAFGAYITQQTAFSLSILLTTRMDALRSMKGKSAENPLMAQLLADASDCIDQPEEKAQPVLESGKVFGWISGFGEYARQAARDQNPSFHYLSEAVLAGFDYQGVNRGAAGIAIGYAHTHFSEAQNSGHGNINYYCASLYGHGMFGNFYISPAVWGIFDEVQNTRNISFPDFSEQAQANIYIWQFLPHLEVGYDSRRSWGEIIPFSSLDWAVNWQRGYREEGAAPYNALSPSKNSSMLRSETGLKFCEKWTRDWGSFLLREKLSYVFQKPFGTGTVNTAFTGIPTSFTVTAVDQNLNLGNIGIDFAFMSGKEKRTSITIGYEGEFGSNYWSNQLMLILEKSF